MDTILEALQKGRLFELPDNDKTHALQFLAHVIEASPEIPSGTDVFGLVMKREEAANTGLGKGWGCPHARVPFEGDLMCVVGWSPAGIDYGAPDGKPVHMAVMYLVPSNQRTYYLREISLLAKALESSPQLDRVSELKSLDDVRNYLLDLMDMASMPAGADVRSRMIRLQAKATPQEAAVRDLANLVIEPVTVIAVPDGKPVVLTQHPQLLEALEHATDLVTRLESEGGWQNGGWRVICRTTVNYLGGRMSYDCIAVTSTPAGNSAVQAGNSGAQASNSAAGQAPPSSK
jgi:mannitol/fructose-specific phosphotransferase system IIA component (Ntr-type)